MVTEAFYFEKDNNYLVPYCIRFNLQKPNMEPILVVYIWSKYYQGPTGGKWKTRRTSATSCYPYHGFHTCNSMLRLLDDWGIDSTEVRQAMIDAGWESDINDEE